MLEGADCHVAQSARLLCLCVHVCMCVHECVPHKHHGIVKINADYLLYVRCTYDTYLYGKYGMRKKGGKQKERKRSYRTKGETETRRPPHSPFSVRTCIISYSYVQAAECTSYSTLSLLS